jgi:hypothetical protein
MHAYIRAFIEERPPALDVFAPTALSGLQALSLVALTGTRRLVLPVDSHLRIETRVHPNLAKPGWGVI